MSSTTSSSSQTQHASGQTSPATYRSTEVEFDSRDLAASRRYRPTIAENILDPGDRSTDPFASLGGWSDTRPVAQPSIPPNARAPPYAQELDMTDTYDPHPAQHNDSRVYASPNTTGNARHPSTPTRTVPDSRNRYPSPSRAGYAPATRQGLITPASGVTSTRRAHHFDTAASFETYGYLSPPPTVTRYAPMPATNTNDPSPMQPAPRDTSAHSTESYDSGRRQSPTASYGNAPRRRVRQHQDVQALLRSDSDPREPSAPSRHAATHQDYYSGS